MTGGRLGVLALLGALAGCGGPSRDDGDWPLLTGVGPEEPGEQEGRGDSQAPPAGVLGRTARGDIVLFSGGTGNVLARINGRAEGAADDQDGLQPTDLAYDPTMHAAVTVSGALAARAAEVRAYRLHTQPDGMVSFGRAWRWGWASHHTWAWPAARSLLLLEPLPAPRWRLLDDDGVSRANVLCSRPLSFWTSSRERRWWAEGLVPASPSGGDVNDANDANDADDANDAADAAAPLLVRAEGSETAIEEFELLPIDAGEWSISPAARGHPWTPAGRGAGPETLLLGDAHAGAARLRRLTGSWTSPPVALRTRAPVEQIVALAVMAPEPGAWRTAALLVTSPLRVIAARVDLDLNIDAVEEIEVAGELPQASNPERHLLAVDERRLLVATAEGVLAFEGSGPGPGDEGPDRELLRLDEGFAGEDLRGPLAGPVPLN